MLKKKGLGSLPRRHKIINDVPPPQRQLKRAPVYEDRIMKIAKDKRREEFNKKYKDLFKKIRDRKPTGRINMDDVKNTAKMKKGGAAKRGYGKAKK